MIRYKLRTLLILLAVLPPLLWIGWMKYEAWQAELARRAAVRPVVPSLSPPPPMFRIASGPDEVLQSLGPPPPGYRWIKTANGVAAVSTADAVIEAEQAAAYERAVAAERARAEQQQP